MNSLISKRHPSGLNQVVFYIWL